MAQQREIFIDMTSKSESNPFATPIYQRYLRLENINITESNKYLKALKETLLLLTNYNIARERGETRQLLFPNIEDEIFSLIHSTKSIVFYVESQNDMVFRLNETRTDPMCYIRLINLHVNNDLVIYRKLSGEKYDEYIKTLAILVYFITNYELYRKKGLINPLVPRKVEAHLEDMEQSLRELITLLSN